MKSLIVLSFILFIASSAPIPDSYSKQSYFDSSKLGVQSPDQNCVVRTNGSLLIFRPQILDPTQINITLTNQISATIFTADGKSLYVVTYENMTGTLYEFQIKNGNISEDKINYGDFTSTEYLRDYSASLSSQNKLAMMSGDFNVLALSISKQKKSFQIQTYEFKGKLIGIQWHPIQNQMLLFAQKGDDDTKAGGGLFGFYNTTSKDIIQINTLSTQMIKMAKNGTILFQSWYYLNMDTFKFQGSILIYSYINGQIRQIENNDVDINAIYTSNDGKLFGLLWSDFRYNGYARLGVYKQRVNSSISDHKRNQQNSTQKDNLGIVYFNNFESVCLFWAEKGYHNFYKFHGMSPDGNQIYIHDGSNDDSRYSRCIDGTYPLNGECLNCSLGCKTCHKSSTQCRLCHNGSYYNNEKCLPCKQKFIGCISCYSQQCLLCNQTALFDLYPTQGKCYCPNNYYYNQNSSICKTCSSSILGCEKCSNSTKCTSCNYLLNFVLDYSTNLCVCRQGFSLVNGICQEDHLMNLQPWELSLVFSGFLIVFSICVVCICKKRKSKKSELIPFPLGHQNRVDPSSLMTQNQQIPHNNTTNEDLY